MRLILCADDFAFSPQVSRVIAELADDDRLNAISCMAVLPNWPEDSLLLRDLPQHVEIGLHLVLTLEAPATPMPRLAPGGVLPTIKALGRMAARGTLPIDEIRAEIQAQFARFIAAYGRPPAFVDGHQHAHALPGIREIVLSQTAARAPGAWIRNCSDGLLAMAARPFFGKAIASAFHSRGLRQAAARYGLVCNDSFGGHYGFSGDYSTIFPRFLRRPGAMHLVMCHPGGGVRAEDGIAAARLGEAAALRTLPIADMASEQGLAFPA